MSETIAEAYERICSADAQRQRRLNTPWARAAERQLALMAGEVEPILDEDDDDEYDLDRMDAESTDIYQLLGDEYDPYDPHMNPAEREMAMDYLLECLSYEENPAVKAEAEWQILELYYSLKGPITNMPPISPDNPWIEVKDGDPRLFMVFQDHYSYQYKPNRKSKLCIGPGFKLPLIVPNATDPAHGRPQAIFAWRLEKYRADDDYGVCCAFYRLESRAYLASDLLLAAEEHALARWPYIPRMFTTIDTTKVKPMKRHGIDTWGYTYTQAGWTILAKRTKSNNLLRLEKHIEPLGLIQTWDTIASYQEWKVFPQRYRFMNPNAGGRPNMEKAVRQPRPTRRKPDPQHQPPLL